MRIDVLRVRYVVQLICKQHLIALHLGHSSKARPVALISSQLPNNKPEESHTNLARNCSHCLCACRISAPACISVKFRKQQKVTNMLPAAQQRGGQAVPHLGVKWPPVTSGHFGLMAISGAEPQGESLIH